MGQSEPQPAGNLQQLFSTPLWTFSYDRAEAANLVLRKVLVDASQIYPSVGRSNVGGWRSRNDLFHWDVPELKELGAWIMDRVRQVVEETAKPDRYRGSISAVGWATICRAGNYHAPHIHPESAWSGVYYVETGDPDSEIPLSGCLELLDPRPAAGGINTPGDPFGHPFRIAPVGGLLVLFPGWLTHWVHPHSGGRERIAISFNVAATSAVAATE